MVQAPADYPYSSYRANALGEPDALVRQHALFARLGPDAKAQQKGYRELFQEKLEEQFVDDLRAATNGGWALGDERFKKEIAEAAKRRADPLPKGRPPEPRRDKRQINLL